MTRNVENFFSVEQDQNILEKYFSTVIQKEQEFFNNFGEEKVNKIRQYFIQKLEGLGPHRARINEEGATDREESCVVDDKFSLLPSEKLNNVVGLVSDLLNKLNDPEKEISPSNSDAVGSEEIINIFLSHNNIFFNFVFDI